MKKIIILLFVLGLGYHSVQAQSINFLELYCGSNAPWGFSQYLSIDNNGNGLYKLSEVNKGVKDSIKFKISPAQVKEITDVLTTIKFFNLAESYNAKSRDGTRLSAWVMLKGKEHTVHWVNIHTSESTQMLDKINALLQSKNIKMTY